MLGSFQQLARQFRAFAAEMREAALELALPPTCRLCQEPVPVERDFCESCERPLVAAERSMTGACRRCARPQGISAVNFSSLAGIDSHPAEFPTCRQCVKESYGFDAAVALWPYHGSICEIVVASKYSSRLPLADAMGRRLGRRWASLSETPVDRVTYVPSHFFRQASRGGTSSQVIAEAVARVLGVKCERIVKMTRRIEKQAWLDDAARVENVRGAFALSRRSVLRGLPDLTNRHILLVDDVLTSGATANEVSAILRAGGARKVSLATVARALRN